MFIKGLLIAGAAGLISSVAFAQGYENGAQAPTTVNPKPSMSGPPTSMPPSTSTAVTPAAPAASSVATDVVAISPDQARAQGLPVQIVASAPVPDTAANRAKYGGPLSMTGKRTAAKGN